MLVAFHVVAITFFGALVYTNCLNITTVTKLNSVHETLLIL